MGELKTPEMTLVFLPTDAAAKIKGFENFTGQAAVFAFRVSLAGKIFYLAFALGDDLSNVSPAGNEAIDRACAAARGTAGKTLNAILLLNRHVETAGARTLAAMGLASPGQVLISLCSSRKVWDASTAPLFSPKVTLVSPGGKIYPPLATPPTVAGKP
jgi:hypothetical protein